MTLQQEDAECDAWLQKLIRCGLGPVAQDMMARMAEIRSRDVDIRITVDALAQDASSTPEEREFFAQERDDYYARRRENGRRLLDALRLNCAALDAYNSAWQTGVSSNNSASDSNTSTHS